MKSTITLQQLWTCPKCGRKFARHNQSHSCKPYALVEHFRNKPGGELLYKVLKAAIKKQVGHFKVESLECCIHFVSTFTFAAVKIFREKIRVDFSLGKEIKNKRLSKTVPLSAHRYLYYSDIYSETDIDKELISWIMEAYHVKNENARLNK